MQDIQRNTKFEELCPPKKTQLYKSPKLFLRGHTLYTTTIWLHRWTSLSVIKSS